MPTNRQLNLRGALNACPRALRTRLTAGFTLLELLIVIGVIGILAAVLLSQFSGATESARAAECLTHMRNLATAVQNCGMAENYYPAAGDSEYIVMDNDRERYRCHKGFISRYSASNPYARRGGASSHQSLQSVSPYATDPEQRRYCVTNSAIWAYGTRKMDEYVCPSHKKFARAQGLEGPGWSYVMNAAFGYDWSDGAESTAGPHREVAFGSCKRPDKRLLFAELQWVNCCGIEPNFATGPDTALDGVLQYDRSDWSGTKEAIGFNHKVGKNYIAHVCFADGHTEKLALPAGGSSAQLIELTKWLCDADDIQFDGSTWQRRHKASDEN